MDRQLVNHAADSSLYYLASEDHSLTLEAQCRRERILSQLRAINRYLENLPQEDFSCRANGDRGKWYLVQPLDQDDDTEGAGEASGRHPRHRFQYIPHSDKALAQQLALRKYLLYRCEDLQNELRSIDAFLSSMKRGCHHAEHYHASSGIADLVDPLLEDSAAAISRWRREPYEHNDYRMDDLNVPTIGGFNVRSKSEALIANILIERDIPFRYEWMRVVGQKTFAPDFTILHPVTLKIIIWEHFGMMDLTTYQSEYWTKMNRYMNSGFIPYINLITTYETHDEPFDVNTANRIVKMMFDR